MLRPSLVVPGSVLLALSAGGCKQYYTADEACVESGRIPGGTYLSDPSLKAAYNRINCYRRLTGLTTAPANELVQKAADGQLKYVAANPDLSKLYGDERENEYLKQVATNPGFTGLNYYDRLTSLETGAGYTFYDYAGTGAWEYIRIVTDGAEEPAPSGEAAIDYLMRDPEFRQVALQPSLVDTAYAEFALTSEWYERGGWNEGNPGVAVPTGGRAYYMIVLYNKPHVEHADKPVFLPKPDQKDVPLYSWSRNQLGVPQTDGEPPLVQLSYAITFLVGALDPANFDDINQNQYNTEITAASIVGPGGPLETEIVHPGDDAEDVWPSATYQRSIIALYARQPFEPGSTYTVYADMSHPEGDFAIEYSFTTANEDPGVDPELGRTTVPVTTP